MNSSPGQEIRIIKPFEDGFTVMKSILFQPFDFGKWLVVGFAAFIAGHYSAGGGFSPPMNFRPPGSMKYRSDSANFDFHNWAPLLTGLVIGLIIFFLVLILVFMWIKARGTFVFTDCIVRNRAAIKATWREFRREGNSLFLFYLGLAAVACVIVAIIVAAFIAVATLGHFSSQQSAWTLITVGVVGFTIYISVVVALGLIGYFMPIVMYRRRCLSMEAFRTVASLVWQDPGAFILFALFGVFLCLGWLMVAAVVTCATCCMALLPYVGTVCMLPVFVWLRSFGLLFLRQFGPDFDVWAGAPPIPPPLPPAPVATT